MRSLIREPGASSPVQALDLVGQDHAGDAALGGKGDFEGLVLDPGCDRTEKCPAGLIVVDLRTQNQGRTVARMFVSDPGSEPEPHDVRTFGNIVLLDHS